MVTNSLPLYLNQAGRDSLELTEGTGCQKEDDLESKRTGFLICHLRQRILKEAVHELGHTFGLGHCPDALCVMRFSNSLADTDYKRADFCKSCRRVVEKTWDKYSKRKD